MSDVVYSKEDRVEHQGTSYYGYKVGKDKMDDKGINNFINDKFGGIHMPSVDIEHLSVGNLVRVSFGRFYETSYNKTVYRVNDIVDSKKRFSTRNKKTNVFLEPISNKAKCVRIVYTVNHNSEGKLNSKCYSLSKITNNIKRKIEDMEPGFKYRTQQVSENSNEREINSVVVLPDKAIHEYYDTDSTYTLVNI